MSDLRERVQKAIFDAGAIYESSPATDAALAEVATWLRERAAMELEVPERTYAKAARRSNRADVLLQLADEISPTHDEGQTP